MPVMGSVMVEVAGADWFSGFSISAAGIGLRPLVLTKKRRG
jgi:hypothetical protein